MALTSDRHTTRRDGVENTDPVAADTTIHAGALVVLDASGNAEPGSAATGLTARGVAAAKARDKAAGLLSRLNLPEKLWSLPPATFSGGEQQRVNIARGFITDHPVLLLDEPTASLDAKNREVVIALIAEKKQAKVALLGIFHDADVREAVADRIIDVTQFAMNRRVS